MKRFALILAGVALTLAAVSASAVPVPLKIAYTLPTQACTFVNGVATGCTAIPATGPTSLAAIDVYISTSPIADDSTMTPTVSLDALAQTYSSSFQAGNGDTIYVRLKARDASGNRSGFSNTGTKDVTVKVVPNSPVIVTIDIAT